MLAFHGKRSVKAKYLKRVIRHKKADQIVQNYGYFRDGKGCAVGCTIHGSAHQDYEKELGIPAIIAHLEDRIFEGLPVKEARSWPLRFLIAIKPGADLSQVWHKFAVWLLIDKTDGVIKYAKSNRSSACINSVSDLYLELIEGRSVTAEAWREVRNKTYAAYADADDAADAAYAAAYAVNTADAYAAAANAANAAAAAADAYAANAAAAAADAYADDAADAAYAAAYAVNTADAYAAAANAANANAAAAAAAANANAAADDAADAAYAAAYAYAAYAYAYAYAVNAAAAGASKASYVKQSEKLLQLLREAEVKK